MERPIVLSTSTRSRSLFGAQPQETTYSCRRNSRPKPKISAPRRMVVRAICAGGRFFLAKFFRDQGERDSREKEKQRRGEGSAQLRVHEEPALPGRRAQPGIVAVGLEHQHAGQPAHPVDVGEAGFGGVGRGHARPRVAGAVYGSGVGNSVIFQDVTTDCSVNARISGAGLTGISGCSEF